MKGERKWFEMANTVIKTLKGLSLNVDEHIKLCNECIKSREITDSKGIVTLQDYNPVKISDEFLFKRAYWPEICTKEELSKRGQTKLDSRRGKRR
jgi:hypothetical protein